MKPADRNRAHRAKQLITSARGPACFFGFYTEAYPESGQ